MPTQVTTPQLADLAVTAAKIANATITKAKMAAASVGATQVEPGAVVQVVNAQTGAVATGTTTIPGDDTIPQITEGNEYMTLAVTPLSATNLLKIDVVIHLANTAAGYNMAAALFRDATANALACVSEACQSANHRVTLTFSHWMTAGQTTAITFRVRAGADGAGTTTFNGVSGGRLYGGVMASSITITEVKA